MHDPNLFASGALFTQDYLAEGIAADYDSDGRLAGIEVLASPRAMTRTVASRIRERVSLACCLRSSL